MTNVILQEVSQSRRLAQDHLCYFEFTKNSQKVYCSSREASYFVKNSDNLNSFCMKS